VVEFTDKKLSTEGGQLFYKKAASYFGRLHNFFTKNKFLT